MFNFSEDDFVPGFRVRDPKDDIPGFRRVPDCSIQQNPSDILAFVRRYFPPEGWPAPGVASNQTTNLAFGFGGGLAGIGGDPTQPLPSSRQPYFEPVAAGDLRCQGACSQG